MRSVDQGARLSHLLELALGRPPEERPAFVEGACAGNAAMRQQLESLLHYASRASGFLETPLMLEDQILTATPGMGDMVGHEVGPYQIVAPLAKGGMGEVYRARDPNLNREVALKFLPQHLASDPERRRRFAREARLLATLTHPNIGRIYGWVEDGGHIALVLELVEGPTLAERLASGPLPVGEAVEIARQIAQALDAAHEKGIVHRDLKPANIVLQTNAGSDFVRAIVLDFGLAKETLGGPAEADGEVRSASTETTIDGRILGTPTYMSPEQARGAGLDKRTDLWAFGCVLFEMLTGEAPFEGETAAETIARVLVHEPDWTRLPPRLPPALHDVLRRCLQKDPARRIRDIRDAVLSLDDSSSVAVAARTGIRRMPFAAVGAAAAGAAMLFAIWLRTVGLSTTTGLPAMHLDIDLGPVAGIDAGMSRTIGIAPNGERVLFIWNGQLRSRRLDDGASVPLAGTEGTVSFAFSPDSQSVAFVADRKLKRVPVGGGVATTICDVDAASVRGMTWGDDNTIVFAEISGGLKRVAAVGGSVEPLSQLDANEFSHRWPRFLPGAGAVLFTSHAYPEWWHRARIDALSLATGGRKTVVKGATFGDFVAGRDGKGYLTFLRSGTLFAVPFDPIRLEALGSPFAVVDDIAYHATTGAVQESVSNTGMFVYRRSSPVNLSWLDPSGIEVVLPPDAAPYSDPALSSDGSRLAFSLGDDLWVYDVRRRMRTQVTKSIPAFGPVWTPDGRFIVFSTMDNIAWVAADGGAEPQVLLEPKRSVVRFPTSIHLTERDGRLAFMELNVGNRSTAWDLWTVPVFEDVALRAGKPEPFLTTEYDERQPRFSPDGRFIAYSSTESGARHEIYVRTFPDDGRRWTVSAEGGTVPQWSAGKQPALFFVSASRRLMAAAYSVSGTEFSTATPRVWSSEPLVDYAAKGGYSVSLDGTRVVALVPEPAADQRFSHELVIWTGALDEFAQRRTFLQQHRP